VSLMRRPLRVLVVGVGSPNADLVAEILAETGVHAEWTDRVKFPDPSLIRRFDVVYGIYLQTCSRYILVARLLGRKTLLHFVGSDAYWLARERSFWRQAYWSLVLVLSNAVLYVSPHLEQLTRRKGFILPFPISGEYFTEAKVDIVPDRDVLYYCPSGSVNEKIYRLSWILEYARMHQDEKITIIGNIAHPAHYKTNLPNVKVIPYVDRFEMPSLYKRHKRLIRMTTEDGLPRMVHEALRCGLTVVFNGKEVSDIPRERDPELFACHILRVLRTLR